MKMAGGGCLGCGVLLIMAALVVFCAAAVPDLVAPPTARADDIGGAARDAPPYRARYFFTDTEKVISAALR